MRRILITGARAPVALHLTRCLTEAGHSVFLADSLCFPLARATRLAQTYVRLPEARRNPRAYGYAVADACRAHDIDLIIPTCEEVFYLAAARDCFGVALPLLAPSFEDLALVHDKYRFSKMAQGFGADPAETHLLATQDAVRAFCLPGDWIFKPVWSRFGDRVLIRPDKLDRLRVTPEDPWIAQRYLAGEELCAYAIAQAGRLVALQAYRPLYRAGNGIGAGVMVEPMSDPAIDQFVNGLVAHLNWTGQISFDFRRDEAGGVHVLECNPRATTGAHLFQAGDGLAGALIKGVCATASEKRSLGVPLAMLIFGLPDALRNNCVTQWRRDLAGMGDLLESPDDRGTLPWQCLALGEAIVRAVAGTQSLKAAATADIEWNGEDLL